MKISIVGCINKTAICERIEIAVIVSTGAVPCQLERRMLLLYGMRTMYFYRTEVQIQTNYKKGEKYR